MLKFVKMKKVELYTYRKATGKKKRNYDLHLLEYSFLTAAGWR